MHGSFVVVLSMISYAVEQIVNKQSLALVSLQTERLTNNSLFRMIRNIFFIGKVGMGVNICQCQEFETIHSFERPPFTCLPSK